MIPFRLRRETACMVMVDVQERLLPAISGAEEIRRNTVKLAAAAKVLSIPFVYTEQYPRGLGPTDGEILTALPDGVTSMEKNTFSCCDEAAFEELLQGTGRPVPVIFGIETHICVLATVLDLLEKGRKVVLASDACGSRDPLKAERALSAMASAGAMVVPVESVIYHLMGRSGTPEFKELLPLFKE
ncbi:MAG TPA: isochorismatase family protein [Aminivibrio sp.]|uniref:isochorismatase family protein n=1 Tax=Aminivibrio sp. TaxID=1872489 RepID=UPI002B2129DC|nr:isochorismatase family protein [Aminivibrio sp.]MEA4953609.1 isochorismatase family protein [Aminivibrio sp.]NCB16947.1 isochorismatase family protein [Synergistales bacterium]HPF84906.1 isochorismatase family protein [Aminivibrio sp.]